MRKETENIVVRSLQADDGSMISAYHVQQRAFLSPWEPLRKEEFYTESFWQEEAERICKKAEDDQQYTFLIFELGNEKQIVGLINLANIVRGAFQACHLGYRLSHMNQGKGWMTEALQIVIAHAFSDLNLHRIMANYEPRNPASSRVLEKLGFQKEGTAKDYLFLAGEWRDHILTSLINKQWKSPTD